MVVFTVMIMNRAGSLLFVRDYDDIPRLLANERIMLASTFHGLSAIAGQLSPGMDNSGMQTLEADTFKLHSFMPLTGMNFLMVADPTQTGMDGLLRRTYELYADFVLKNPFYTLEMPIRCSQFDKAMEELIESADRGPAWRSNSN